MSVSPPPFSSRVGIYVLAAGQTICWAGLYYVFAALLLSWERSLGWAKTDLTIALTVAVLMSALAAPVAGRIIDAGGGRWLLTGGALGGAAALAVLSTVTTLAGFVATWAAIGVMQGACLYEVCFAFVTRCLGDKARPGVIRVTLVAGFASPLAFTAGFYLSDAFGWRDAVLFIALTVAALGAPLHWLGARMLERDAVGTIKSVTERGQRSALNVAIRKPVFWLIAIAFPVVALNHGIFVNHVVPLLVERGLPNATAVAAASLFGPMQVAGRLLMMGIKHRVATLTWTLISFGGLIAGALLLFGAGANVPMVFAFAAAQGAAFGLVSILRPILIAEVLGRDGFGSIAGWLAVPYLAGFAFAPWIGALLWDVGGYDLMIAVAVMMAGLGFVAIVVLRVLNTREFRPADL